MSTKDAPVAPVHPAKFSKPIIEVMREMIDAEHARIGDEIGEIGVLDPFAGVGGIHDLLDEGRIETFGLELQPEWAAAHDRTNVGNVLQLTEQYHAPWVNVVATSPCYGNRMADHHDAQEKCRACRGTGFAVNPGQSSPYQGCCDACFGRGVRTYERNTYAHKLRAAGVEPVDSPDNAQVMQWGAKYREFHEQAWRACDHVLFPGGLVVLNVKNHIRTVGGREVEQHVIEFHVNVFFRLGYTLQEARPIPTRGLAFGQNHDTRTEAELVVALRKPSA